MTWSQTFFLAACIYGAAHTTPAISRYANTVFLILAIIAFLAGIAP